MALKVADSFAVDQTRYGFMAVQVNPKPGKWDESTKSRSQQISGEGVPVWLVECLRMDQVAGESDLVSVRIDSRTKPEVAGGMVVFENLIVRSWSITDRESGSLSNAGVSLSATSVSAA